MDFTVARPPSERYLPSIALIHLEWAEFAETVTSAVRRDDLAGSEGATVVVQYPKGPERAAPHASPSALATLTEAVAGLPCLIVLDSELGPATEPARVADVVASGEGLEAIVERASANPIAATCLAMLLRSSEHRTVEEGLLAESATYSTLQAGTEFARWKSSRPGKTLGGSQSPAVVSRRSGQLLTVRLNRPEVRNALGSQMRDELWEALGVAAADPDVEVLWSGEGDAFCSGGDLDEFGGLPDPARGHLTRLTRSIARRLHEISARVTVELHGPCLGAGIELPAFAARVKARRDTRVGLPELSLGLIPGAGGTVSLPRRIGRHRTAWLVLSAEQIGVDTALEWGLVDEIFDS